MKGKFLRDFSANSLQVFINQICGLAVFYILSAFLVKSDFGELNWSLAVLLTVFSILSFGLDQVLVKKIAAGENPSSLLVLYLAHVLVAGFIFYGLLLASQFIFTAFFSQHRFLILLGIGKLMIFFTIPFKQTVTGLEKFRPLLFMMVCSNVFRTVALLLLTFFGYPDIYSFIFVFIVGDAIEFFLSFYIVHNMRLLNLPWQINLKKYFTLIKESMPQMGVVIFTSAMARFDWILLGMLATTIVLAEYSFAYKVFEVATLPLLIIAPILVTRFTKIFNAPITNETSNKLYKLLILLRLEIFAACCLALALNIFWLPVINFITANNYGEVNVTTIFLLSVAMPFIYYNNFMWTINFSKDRLKLILFIYGLTFFINVVADIILIPIWQAEGAAYGYLLAIISQSILFSVKTRVEEFKTNSLKLIIIPFFAFASWLLSSYLFQNVILIFLTALFLLVLLLFFSRVFHRKDFLVVKNILGL